MSNRPNVIIVLTDDQGYGDLSCHGNPVLKTPNLDKLHSQSVRLTDFHVAPMCTPTRCQLLTGVNSLVGGASFVDGGRAYMHTDLPVMPELFAEAGYRTGHFGKWHLGDHFPHRPEDRGWQETVHHSAWGVTSVPDYWNNDYFDDHYTHNGSIEQYEGYCTDVWFNQAMSWMRDRHQRGEPFLTYLATNAPHGPLFVGDDYRRDYGDQKTAVASFFGMIACIDENMGRLDAMLQETGLADNTILIYMTDNGGTVGVQIFNAGMRGRKCELYEGGHRVPCFVRWPAGGLREPSDVPGVTMVEDILPTLLEVCGIADPADAAFEGTSLAGLLRGECDDVGDRKLVVQYGTTWGRPWSTEWFGDPHMWDSCVMWNRWRLVNGDELYDLEVDPGQETNVATANPEVLADLRDHYERWWAEREERAFEFCYIPLGAPEAPEVCLTSHMRLLEPVTGQFKALREGTLGNGPWNVDVMSDGDYTISLRRWPKEADAPIAGSVPAFVPGDPTFGPFPEGKSLPIAEARIAINAVDHRASVGPDDTSVEFTVSLAAGKTRLQSWFLDADANELCGAYYAYVSRT